MDPDRGGRACSVVVCCRNRPQLLAESLVTVRAALRAGDELVVVDSDSTTTEVAVVAEAAGARVIRADRPGASRARNLGWRAARNELIAFTDDDCRPDADWLDALAGEFEDTSVGFVFGAVAPTGSGAALSVTDRGRLSTDIRPGSTRTVADFGHGANLAVRRSALDAVGGWDESLGAGVPLAGAEDVDLAMRLLRGGWAGRFSADAAVSHAAWRNRGQALRAEFGYGVGGGAVAVRSHRLDGDWWLLRHHVLGGIASGLRKDLATRYEYGIAAGLVRLAGVARGVAAARTRLP